MSAAPETILITGASGGLGAALAHRYARPGRTLVLHGRDGARLGSVVGACEQRGARVLELAFDQRDPREALGAIEALLARERVDLAILNAGTSLAGGATEPWADVEALLTVNLLSTIALASALVPAMRAHGRGQLAFVSSLAAWHGLPLTPAYCASKAALKAYAEALRPALAAHGIAVSVVMPGFVRTPMSDAFPGAKPFMITAEDAAQRIERGLAANRARIAFPQPLAFGAWLLAALPAALSQRLVRRLGF